MYVLPSSNPLILWGSFVLVQLSTTSPFSFITLISAPSISLPPISSFVIVTTLSIIVTFCVSAVFSTVNLISVDLTNPSGARSSRSVYSFPTVNPSIVWVLSVDVHSSIRLPSSSTTDNFAPSSSFSPVISVLLISVRVVSFSTSNSCS